MTEELYGEIQRLNLAFIRPQQAPSICSPKAVNVC